MLDKFNKLIKKSKNGYAKYEDSFKALNNAYLLNYSDEKKQFLQRHDKSALYFPKLNAKAKRIMDALSQTYFESDKMALLENNINSDDRIIEMWQYAFDYYCKNINLYAILQPEFLKVSFLGTSIAKIYWDNDKPNIEMLDIDKVFFDTNAKNYDDLRYIIHEFSLTKGDIKRYTKNKVYKNADLELEDDEYKRYKLYDIYELKEGKWLLSTVFDDKAILRQEVELKDGLPIICGYTLAQVKKIGESDFIGVYGEPPLASVLSLQDEFNSLKNASIEATKQHLYPKLLVDKNAQIDRDELINPTSPIYVKNLGAVSVLPKPDINFATLNIQAIDNDMSETSGVSPQQNGATSVRAETATMSSIMANEGSVRLNGYIRTYNETFIEPLFYQFAKLIYKYGDPMFFIGVDRSEVMSFKLNLECGIGALNKEVQKRNLIESSNLLGNHFQMCLAVQDTQGAELIKDAHEELISKLMPLFGVKDFDKYRKEKESDRLYESQQ
ncbi:portal protein [Campylobacter hyointestinalis]|uniref:portal protein n=1 Tax=Campylobacter hyointestinalis TaxID=198 RepID=UPI000CE5451A|nr:phage head-tail adapter protein [Campylobacter hyointestinalis]PPB65680.1 phage head-tail adapter protein [Campylobacter hyointestinalis subsp. hyointestinalis]